MEAPERGALMLVRFAGLALIGWSVAELALCWAVSRHNHTALETLPVLAKSIPLVAGSIILARSRALAEWLADLLD